MGFAWVFRTMVDSGSDAEYLSAGSAPETIGSENRLSIANLTNSHENLSALPDEQENLSADCGPRLGDKYVALNEQGESKSVQIITVDQLASKVYIHYIDADKRLDEWIPIDRLQNRLQETTQEGGRNQVEKKFTRTLKRKLMETNNTLAYLAELDSNQAKFEKARDEATKVKNIQQVHFDKYLFDAWYFSPYPDEYGNGSVQLLHVCGKCFKYFRAEQSLLKHICKHSDSPPGKCIYSKDNYNVYEINGEEEKLFCQNLCLFSKLFLDHKTLYYNVQFFNFYLLFLADSGEFVGYFSKERNSSYDYNLSCILTLPSHQRQGWGRFLIQFSYALSRSEHKTGTPEKPLSDLGTLSYRKFWCSELVHLLAIHPNICSVKELSRVSGFAEDDVHQTLQSLNLLKYWKDEYVIEYDARYLQELSIKYLIDSSREKIVDPSLIRMNGVILHKQRIAEGQNATSGKGHGKGKGKGKNLLQLRRKRSATN